MISMYQISPLGSIDFGATGKKAILQNASFLLATMKGTSSMDRNFGWEPPVDDLSESAQTKMSAEVIELLESNFPEISVEEVTFDETKILEGILYPIVKLVFIDG